MGTQALPSRGYPPSPGHPPALAETTYPAASAPGSTLQEDLIPLPCLPLLPTVVCIHDSRSSANADHLGCGRDLLDDLVPGRPCTTSGAKNNGLPVPVNPTFCTQGASKVLF